MTLERYREPLISAAYDLQSRIYNVLRQRFLKVYVEDNQWGRRQVALSSTVYVFAQYFGWREILRQEIQFLRLAGRDETQRINRLLSRITGEFASDTYGPRFLLWKPEQRAMGEVMIGSWADAPTCIGYHEFTKKENLEIGAWMQQLERDLVDLAPRSDDDRLKAIQHLLVELIRELDPEELRYPPERLKLA